jgi:hypothetical protein
MFDVTRTQSNANTKFVSHRRALQKARVGALLRDGAQSTKRAFFAQPAAFAFRSSAPDTELFFVVQRVFETLRPHVALTAHGARSLRRTAALGEEDLWVDLGAARVRLPLDGLKKLRRDPLHPPVLSFPLDPVAPGKDCEKRNLQITLL